MINGFLHIFSRQSLLSSRIQQITLSEPLEHFARSGFYGKPKIFRTIATSLAKQTSFVIESLLADERIEDWSRAAESITGQRLRDLGILCSNYILHFALQEAGGGAARTRLDTGLRTELFDLARLMYGDFAKEHSIEALTFRESMESADLNDPQEMWYLTRLVDQLLGVDPLSDNSQRDLKMQKLQEHFSDQRAFAYTLHSAL